MYTAFFGYINQENFVVSIPIGSDNSFSGGTPTNPQTTIFEVGTQSSAVSVDFQAGITASWHLPSGTASATTNSPVCPGSVPKHVACVGVPSTTATGCAIVVQLPNTAGPTRDPAVLGRPVDPIEVPSGTIDEDFENEAAILQTHFLPANTFPLGPNATNTISVNISERSAVFVKVTWRTAASVTLAIQQGSKTVSGVPVSVGAHGGAVDAMSLFLSGAVQIRVQNVGSTSVTLSVTPGILPMSATL